MPERHGQRSHRFDRVRDAVWLAAALTVSAKSVSGDGVEVHLSQTAPGHAFPTGDLFRRLEVGAAWCDAQGHVLGESVAYLARHFELTQDFHLGRELVRDNRVRGGESVVVLEPISGGVPRTARWWVSLQRVATVGNGRDPRGAEIASEVLLHQGEVDLR